jgi:hypothetical protein
LGAGAGAGLPKAVVWIQAGINSSTQVTALNNAGVTGYAVESYAELGYPYNDLNRMLWQGTQFGMTAAQSIPMVGTYRGETPDDYTGLDENVLPNYGIYSAPQTSEAGWAAFAELNKGIVMLSKPVIDVPNTAVGSQGGVMTVGSPNLPVTGGFGADGAFEGYISEVVLYFNALNSADHRAIDLSGKYGDTGTVPPQEQIPTGGIQPGQIAPGGDGQHLVTDGGTVHWTADTGGAGIEYENVWNTTTAYQAGDVVTYNGIDYLAVNPSTGQTPPAITAAPRVTYGTTPPVSPADGDKWVFPFDATAGVIWEFRYRTASSSSYKWEFVGGGDAYALVTALETIGATGVWSDLATVGPLVILPRSGDYDVIAYAQPQGPAGATMQAAISRGTAVAVNATAITSPSLNAYTNLVVTSRVTVAASDDLRLRYQTSALTTYFANRWLRVRPVRIS